MALEPGKQWTTDSHSGGRGVSIGRCPEVLSNVAPFERLQGEPVPILHRVSSETLSIQFTRWAREQLAHFSVDLTYRELPIEHGITQESLDLVTGWLSAQLDPKTPA